MNKLKTSKTLRKDPLLAVYNSVRAYCTNNGYIDKLEATLKIPETIRFNHREISTEGLHILDAVHCIYDEKRTLLFLKEIKKHLKADSKVIEAGIGTGILTFYAATKSKEVIGLELNPEILDLAKGILKDLQKKSIVTSAPTLRLGSATRVELPFKADVVINENIYTGMFFEKQVQIARHLRKFLKPGGVMIPQGMSSYIALAESNLPKGMRNKEVLVLQDYPSLQPKLLSEFSLYDSIDFVQGISSGVELEREFLVKKKGKLNSLVIYSDVLMPSGTVITRKMTIFLNNEILMVIQPRLDVERGDRVRVNLRYKYGGKPHSAQLKVSILRDND